MKLEITHATIECGKPAYLVSIDGEASEPMSLEALKPYFGNPNDEIIVNIPDPEERREAA